MIQIPIENWALPSVVFSAHCTLTAIHCKMRLLWWELSYAPTYKYSNKSWGVTLMLCLFSRIIKDFSTRDHDLSGPRFLVLLTATGISSVSRIGLKYNEKVVGYFWSTHPTTAPAGRSCSLTLNTSLRLMRETGDHFSPPVVCTAPSSTVTPPVTDEASRWLPARFSPWVMTEVYDGFSNGVSMSSPFLWGYCEWAHDHGIFLCLLVGGF